MKETNKYQPKSQQKKKKKKKKKMQRMDIIWFGFMAHQPLQVI